MSTYTGYVEVTVSGIGQSLGTAYNDAFYLLTGQDGSQLFPPVADPQYYQLTFGTTTLVGLDPAQDIANSIVYDVATGSQVTPRYVPAYESSGFYSFVVAVGSASPSQLHFGVSDGFFSDNTGFYLIDLQQLTVVPEPSSLVLCGISGVMGLTVALVRREAGHRSGQPALIASATWTRIGRSPKIAKGTLFSVFLGESI